MSSQALPCFGALGRRRRRRGGRGDGRKRLFGGNIMPTTPTVAPSTVAAASLHDGGKERINAIINRSLHAYSASFWGKSSATYFNLKRWFVIHDFHPF